MHSTHCKYSRMRQLEWAIHNSLENSGFSDWCMTKSAKVTMNSMCYTVVDDFVIRGDEMASGCGPHGHLAVLNSQALHDVRGRFRLSLLLRYSFRPEPANCKCIF